MSDAVFEAVADVVAHTFHCDRARLSPSTQSFDVEGWDSLSHVYFVMNVEQALNVKLPLDAVMACADVGEFVAAVRGVLGRSPS